VKTVLQKKSLKDLQKDRKFKSFISSLGRTLLRSIVRDHPELWKKNNELEFAECLLPHLEQILKSRREFETIIDHTPTLTKEAKKALQRGDQPQNLSFAMLDSLWICVHPLKPFSVQELTKCNLLTQKGETAFQCIPKHL
jgi:hypothetical protein